MSINEDIKIINKHYSGKYFVNPCRLKEATMNLIEYVQEHKMSKKEKLKFQMCYSCEKKEKCKDEEEN